MAFTNKQISLTFTLGQGNFGETGSNQVTVSGLRISAKIVTSGSQSMCECQLRVFGLTPTIYNTLTSIYATSQATQRNTVSVSAGDSAKNMAVVFIGQITLAQIDLNNQPDSVMNIIAQTALLQALAPVAATSYPNGASVATAMQSLATAMGFSFINSGVVALLPKPTYLPGTAWQQCLKIIEISGINWNGCANGQMVIWNRNTPRKDITAIPTVSYLDNMIGYPSYSTLGIGVKCQYNPAIQYGGQVKVLSSLTIANLNGLWWAYHVIHTLESNMPDGHWMTEFQGQNVQALS